MASTSRKYSKNMFFSKNNMICLARFDFVLENPLKKTLKLENNLFPFKNIFLEKWNRPSKCRQNLIFLSFFSILVHILGRNHFFQKNIFAFTKGTWTFVDVFIQKNNFFEKNDLFWAFWAFAKECSISFYENRCFSTTFGDLSKSAHDFWPVQNLRIPWGGCEETSIWGALQKKGCLGGKKHSWWGQGSRDWR